MIDYKLNWDPDCRIYLGCTDVATLKLSNGKGRTDEICTGEDGCFYADIYTERMEIPSGYKLHSLWSDRLDVSDDDEVTASFDAYRIEVFRRGTYGTIIRLIRPTGEWAKNILPERNFENLMSACGYKNNYQLWTATGGEEHVMRPIISKLRKKKLSMKDLPEEILFRFSKAFGIATDELIEEERLFGSIAE